MIAPLTAAEADSVHALQCRARRLGVTCDLQFSLDWQVIVVVAGIEFMSIEDAAAHLAVLEVAT